jgi:beta-lactamase class A
MNGNKFTLVVLTILIGSVLVACNRYSSNTTSASDQSNPISPKADNQINLEKELEKQVSEISVRAQGSVSISVLHVETGRTVGVNANRTLPLYSVFKLPLAIVVFKDVEAGRLKADQIVHVAIDEIVPGSPENVGLWSKIRDRTIEELVEVSISRSDNTSTDKLLQLVGGPSRVTEQMRALGFQSIDIHSSVMEFVKSRKNPNTGSAEDLVNLLAQLQQGKILQARHSELIIKFMQGATTGLRRLRGDLPTGTLVADKTGSGEKDAQTNFAKATNDVGLITLPGGRGTLAIAVLLSESKLPDAAQEKLIAELARAAYDAYTKPVDQSSQ